MISSLLAGGVFDMAKTLIDRLVPDPAANAAAQLELMKLDQSGQLTDLQIRMSAILAEANSADPWTSRARPTFMYLFYVVIMFMVMVMPFVGLWFPEKMELFYLYVGKGFAAIPDTLWGTFTVGFLGYSASKTVENVKGVRNPGK